MGIFKQIYSAPWKGINSALPENLIGAEFTPSAQNWIVRGGELRTRPRQRNLLPGLPDGSQITGHTSFADSNNSVHTVVVSTSGLWQLNANWRKFPDHTWTPIQLFTSANRPAPNGPAQLQVFLNQLYFVNGSNNLYNWNGLTPNSLSASNILPSIGIIDQANGLTAGAFFLGELNSQLIMLNTIEQVKSGSVISVQNFTQRIRWSASGLPLDWDVNFNIGAGFNDELDVPDTINGFLTIGTSGFVFRVNGVTEMTPVSGSTLPFDFNHLWASDRGIGNVYPYTIAGYGPLGLFIATDDIYEISLGGFKRVGGVARNAIFADLGQATNSPIGSLFPAYGTGYPYLTYLLSIPIGSTNKDWLYFVEDECWMPWTSSMGFSLGKVRMVPTI